MDLFIMIILVIHFLILLIMMRSLCSKCKRQPLSIKIKFATLLEKRLKRTQINHRQVQNDTHPSKETF